MINRLPHHIPPWSVLLDDIGAPSSDQVAKALQVSVRQVRAWRKLDQAPHMASLAVFWLTRWGRSLADAEAVNLASLATQRAAALDRELAQLRAELARVISLGDFGCANAPTLASSPARPSGPPRLRVIRG